MENRALRLAHMDTPLMMGVAGLRRRSRPHSTRPFLHTSGRQDILYTTLLQEYTHYPSDYHHVRSLAVKSHVYSVLSLYSYLPMQEASQMALTSVTWTLPPRTLRHGFLT